MTIKISAIPYTCNFVVEYIIHSTAYFRCIEAV